MVIACGLGAHATDVKQQLRDKLIEDSRYVGEHGRDMPDIEDWSCTTGQPPKRAIKRETNREHGPIIGPHPIPGRPGERGAAFFLTSN